MGKAAALALGLAGLGSAALVLQFEGLPTEIAGHQSAIVAQIAGIDPAPIIKPQPNDTNSQPRIFSSKQPLIDGPASMLAPNSAVEASAPALPVTSFIAPMIAKSADPGVRKLSSSRPADEDARRELVRDLQQELKRVGCFDGEINGVWNPSTRKAMGAFTERVNATLPLNEPDYILLTLVQGHGAQACGRSCPSGQAMNEDSKCLPRAIIAQRAKRAADRTTTARLDSPAAANAPAPQSGPRVANAWSNVVTAPQQQAFTQSRPAAALPGRMAMGAPVDVPLPPQPAVSPTTRDQALARPPASVTVIPPQPDPSLPSVNSASRSPQKQSLEKNRRTTNAAPIAAAAPPPALWPLQQFSRLLD